MGSTFGPVRSVATAIAELARAAAPTPATPDAPKSALGVARTMTLQMNPAELGTVDIRLHMTGQTLDVQLTISDSQTLGIIKRDRDSLASALHDQNYALNSLVIKDGAASTSSGGNNGSQGDTSGNNARQDRQSSGTGSDTQSSGRQGSGADRSTRGDRRPTRDVPSRAVADGRSGTLYV
jgi:flagellar hook-length control protein FliK